MLVGILIGPVQSFIASANRTRDLWFGSRLLSRLASDVAKAMRTIDLGGEPVFPTRAILARPEVGIPNRLVLSFTVDDVANDADAQLENIFVEARDVLRSSWTCTADETHRAVVDECTRRHISVDNVIDREVWQVERDDAETFELYCAAVPLDASDFRASMDVLNRVLASRKATRTFAQAPAALTGLRIRKSSLDGGRESVLIDDPRGAAVLRALGIRKGEALDALALAKRVLGKDEQFTPLSRIAADPWLRRLPATSLANVRRSYEALVNACGGDGIGSRVSGNNGCYSAFPFDGQYLFASRIDAERVSDVVALVPNVRAQLDKLAGALNGVWKDHGHPSPYAALLEADGDGIGELLGRIKDSTVYAAFSTSVADFALAVPAACRDYFGHCVYAGGDELLAIVPLDKAIDCARRLRGLFNDTVGLFANEKGLGDLTLSVGIGIRHMLDPLGRHRRTVRDAKKLAKGGPHHAYQRRNALGVIVAPRSGSEIALRIRWDDDAAIRRIKEWTARFDRGAAARGLPYAIERAHAESVPLMEMLAIRRVAESDRVDVGAAALARALDRKLGRSRGLEEADCNRLVEAVREMAHAPEERLPQLARELRVCRWLAGHQDGAGR